MKWLNPIFGIALLVAMAPGCSRRVDTQADAQAIRDMETEWNQDFMARNVERLVSHYAEGAVLMAPGMPPAAGKAGIRKVLRAMVADPALTVKFRAARIDVAASGDLGYAWGSYLMTMTDPQTKRIVHDHGSYVTTYRRESDGAWKAVADIATSEVGPPG